MSTENIKNKTIKGFFWRFMERVGAQGVNFIVSIVLARLLAPEMYGTVALVIVFTSILQIFVDSGMGNALIQKKDADDIDFSSVFYFNMLVCIILYLGMFLAAPYIAEFYEKPELVAIVRVMSFSLIISGLKNVQQAYVSRNMMFKKFFFSTLGGTIFSAFVGIGMAYAGFGVWAIVAQDLTNKLIDTTVLWFTVKWRPKLVFSMKRLKELISYGWKLLITGLIDSVYNNIRQLLIGKLYTSQELAFYNRGKQLPNFAVNNINIAIDSVLFPAMSAEQDHPEKVKAMTRRSIKISSYIMWPLLVGLACTAPNVVRLLLTEKWIECVPFLRLFCITCAFHPIHTANLNAIKAMGRSDLFLKLEIIKKTIGITILLSTIKYGVLAMAYSLVIASIFNQIINSWPNKKLMNYSYIEQMKDILPAIILSVISGVCILPINLLEIHYVLKLVIQIIIAPIIYIFLSKVFKLEVFNYMINMLKSFIDKKRVKI